MQATEPNKPAETQSFLTDELERICNEVMAEYGMSFGGVYVDFAKDVASRAIILEREACAKLMSDASLEAAAESYERFSRYSAECAELIRGRSNNKT